MIYRQFASLVLAEAALAQYQIDGFQAYILGNAEGYEVRAWR